MPYQPIEDYGIIGNMHTVALVGKNGSIDWFCSPNFDSPSVFAAILDDRKGGYFKIAPASHQDGLTTKQMYWPETNVLVTRFLSAEGVGEVIDFMPVGEHHDFHRRSELIRRVNVVRGEMNFRMECFPAFNFARNEHDIGMNALGAAITSEGVHIQLTTNLPLEQVGNGLVSDFTLHEGQTATFALDNVVNNRGPVLPLDEEESEHLFAETVEYWRNWLSRCNYKGRWREMVERSALVLKLLTYDPTGAIVAAPTCSLPEDLGGERNWDYRYTWIRDAAFTLYALLRIGFTEEATKFMKFIEARAVEAEEGGSLQVMYGIDGRHELTEETLGHLEGYKGSSPVRIGNGAYNQLQLDIYGELMDSVYIYNKHAQPISFDFWSHLRRLTDWVVENWRQEDEGIWEVRGGRRHFVYSKLMCWVAIDRALRLADARALSRRPGPLGGGAGRHLRGNHGAGLVRGTTVLCPVLRQPVAGRFQPADAPGLLRSPFRPANTENPGGHQPVTGARGTGFQQPGLPLQSGGFPRWAERPRGGLQHLHLLAGGGHEPRRPLRPQSPGPSPAHF